MANDICTMTLTGRLTKDAEITYSGGGLAICNFSVASNYSKKKGDQYVDETSFFNCVMFGKRAEALQRYLTKGQQLAMQVSPRQERWEKDGQKRSMIKLYVDEITLVGSKRSGSTNQQQSGDSTDAYGTQPGDLGHRPGSGDASFEDDVPF